jgi:hypothetical protein
MPRPLERAGGLGREILDVVAGGEEITRRREQHDPHAVIALRLRDRIGHRAIHRVGDRVLLLRPVEADFDHRAVARHENVLFAHG